MKESAKFTKKDVFVVLGCAVFLLANLGAVSSTGRRRAKEFVCFSNLYKWGIVWKSYTDDHEGYFPPRGGGDPWEETMGGWPGAVQPYYENPKLLFCPEATRPWIEGGQPPFASWSSGNEPIVYASYTVNFWLANEFGSKYWRTPYVGGAAYVPLLLDGNWKDAEPYPDDEAPPYDGYWWSPNANEMKRVCINRHNGAVNGLFLDFSARKIGLKELWKLKWHREWPPEGGFPTGGWPDWMQNFKDY